MKVVIAGGGVIGCAIAYYLTQAGVEAVVVERGELASEASGAAAGLLIPPDRAAAPGQAALELREAVDAAWPRVGVIRL